MTTPDELIEAVRERYRGGDRQAKSRILDEMSAVTGLHRKHVMRLMQAPGASGRHRPRPERQRYDQSVVEALVVLWEASDRLCGERPKPLVPILVEAMERHGPSPVRAVGTAAAFVQERRHDRSAATKQRGGPRATSGP
jgi:hypothetical protein